MAPHTRFTLSVVAVGGALGASTAAAQHVFLPFSQRSDVSSLSPRAASEQVALWSSDYAYVVNATVGTPAQPLSLLISSSTGLTWVPDANTVECSPEWYYNRYSSSFGGDPVDYDIPAPYCHWGSFNQTLSSTHLPANQRLSDFSDSYADGTYVSGTNSTDKLAVGDIELDDYPIGIVSSAYRWIGVLGLGRNSSSSSYYSYSRSSEYATVLDRLVSSGKIASPAYSIWLDDARGTSGGLLFGAVDKSRLAGDLVRFAGSSYYAYGSAFGTTLTAINGTTDSGDAMPAIRSNDFPLDVSIGPGEVFSYLPELLADQVASTAGATYNKTLRYYTIPCDRANSGRASFVFQLAGSGGPRLTVETADLVLPRRVLEGYSRRALTLNDTGTCVFGIQKYYSSSSSTGSSSSSSSSDSFNIGSSLLRRTYLVFDLANNELALAPVKFPSGSGAPSPNIAAFESYGASAPSSTGLCTSSYCSSSNSGSGSGSGSGSRSGSGSSSYGDDGLQHWERVAIAIGVSFGALFLVAAVLCVIIWSRRRRPIKDGKEVDEAQSVESGAAAAQTGAPASPPQAPLPVIPEQQEAAPGAGTQALAQAAPQFPPLATEPGGSGATPEAPPSTRASLAVSALSDEPPSQRQEAQASAPAQGPAQVPEPKGKGKEVDRSS